LEELQQVVLSNVLKRIKPGINRRRFIGDAVDSAIRRITDRFREIDGELEVRLEGSLAKDTWISTEAEADIFVLFPVRYSKEEMGNILTEETIKIFGDSNSVLRYAEHPYVTVNLGPLGIDVVPCFKVQPTKWESATDRTIYHTEFIQESCDDRLKDEARLLKAFMKGIGRYGAEIKTGGFSGFLCELLVIHFKSFTGVLKALSELKTLLIIDLKAHYDGRTPEEISAKFNSSFVVVDPIDPERNVASAVSEESLHTFIWASRRFLQRPSERFFSRAKISSEVKRKVLQNVNRSRIEAVALRLPAWKQPPDIIWGQLHRIRKRFETKLLESGYDVIRSADWTDEKREALVLIAIETTELPMVDVHEGPPVTDYANSEIFLSKYGRDARLVSGPFMRNGRWCLLLKRDTFSIRRSLLHALSDARFLGGMPEESVGAIKKSEIAAGKGVLSISRSKEGAEFILRFLHGREWWI